jgi:Protein of unknown function (DUF3306)
VSGDDNFISRWSRRKIQARQEGTPGATREAREAQAREAQAREKQARGTGPEARENSSLVEKAPGAAPAQSPQPLPPVESLTSESDFAPFMREGVDPELRRGAMKKLFTDPRFNVMDGLDVYIDDYSKPDPLPEGWLEKMTQVARLGVFQPKVEPDEARNSPLEGTAEGTANGIEEARAESLPPADPAATSAASIDAPPVQESPLREG